MVFVYRVLGSGSHVLPPSMLYSHSYDARRAGRLGEELHLHVPSTATERLGTLVPFPVPTDTRRPPATWLPVADAARALGIDGRTLRRAITRHARRDAEGLVLAEFDGVRARKVGRRWRVLLDRSWLADVTPWPHAIVQAKPRSANGQRRVERICSLLHGVGCGRTSLRVRPQPTQCRGD